MYSDVDIELAGVSRYLIAEVQHRIPLNYKRLFVCMVVSGPF